jgi:hypothetical protein
LCRFVFFHKDVSYFSKEFCHWLAISYNALS